VPRIELLSCIFAGLSGGLVGVLWSGAVSMPWLAQIARRKGAQSFAPRAETTLSAVAGAAILAAGGAALGFLFWLGWALISLVNAPWYVPGLLFGALTWAGVAVPLLGGAALRLEGFGRVALVLAVEWLVTCLAVGLFCTFAWHRYT
jgi:hypothetical protein